MCHKRISIIITVLLLAQSQFNIYSQEDSCLDSKSNSSLNDNHSIRRLFSGGFFTEGPAVDNKDNVYFSDLTFTSETVNEPGHIWKYNPRTTRTEIYRSPSNMSNGLIISGTNLFICEGADTGGRRIIKTDLNSGKSIILIDKFNGKALNSPNDLTMTEDGIIYFTDPRYSGDEIIEQPAHGVYRLFESSELELVIYNIHMPNGISVTQDNSRLYVGCYQERIVDGEDLLKGNFIAEYIINKNGKVQFNKYIAKYLPPTGPDGIKLGNDGNIYAAIRDDNFPGIYIYSSDGSLINKIIMPEVPSNLTFSNINQDIIYVTAGGSLYKVLINNK